LVNFLKLSRIIEYQDKIIFGCMKKKKKGDEGDDWRNESAKWTKNLK
jgi:hypothetical protein